MGRCRLITETRVSVDLRRHRDIVENQEAKHCRLDLPVLLFSHFLPLICYIIYLSTLSGELASACFEKSLESHTHMDLENEN